MSMPQAWPHSCNAKSAQRAAYLDPMWCNIVLTRFSLLETGASKYASLKWTAHMAAHCQCPSILPIASVQQQAPATHL